jgi:hypothetical protein
MVRFLWLLSKQLNLGGEPFFCLINFETAQLNMHAEDRDRI